MICAINPTCPREQGENANYMNRNKLTKKKKKKGVLGCEEKNKEVLELFEMYYLFDNTCFRTCNINRYLLENQHYKH